MVLVNGGCHCGRVRWAASVPRDAVVVTCSCSVCVKKSNVHVILPKARFDLVSGESELTCYRFNTMQAQHLFCKHCGTQSFYVPRSNPDGYVFSKKTTLLFGNSSLNSPPSQNWDQPSLHRRGRCEATHSGGKELRRARLGG